MPAPRSYVYECMILISQSVAADLAGALEHINGILGRAKAEVLAMRKWDERRLAYEIDKQKRGVYILCYFRAPNHLMSHFERDCNLSEKIMRVMILRADHLSAEEIAAKDGRDALATEAKLRASEPPRTESVSAGAPREGGPAREEPAPASA
jgi:small subunit ribosomal protein S6